MNRITRIGATTLVVPALALVSACSGSGGVGHDDVPAPSLTIASGSPSPSAVTPTTPSPSETSTSPTATGNPVNGESPSTAPDGQENSVQLYLSMGEFKNFPDGERVPRDLGHRGELKPSFALFLDGEVPGQPYCSYKYTVTAPNQSHIYSDESNGLTDCKRHFPRLSTDSYFTLKDPGVYTVEISATYMDGEWYTTSKTFTLI